MTASEQHLDPHPIDKIQFNLSTIREDGLRGPAGGLRSVAYEFCVPKDPAVYEVVRRIDPSVEIMAGSRGRIGCSDQQALCIGDTHQPNWKTKLLEIASLPYVSEIHECFFE